MATANVPRRPAPGTLRYRITFVASLLGLALAAGAIDAAYWQHVEFLNKGDELGRNLQHLNMIDQPKKGAGHVER